MQLRSLRRKGSLPDNDWIVGQRESRPFRSVERRAAALLQGVRLDPNASQTLHNALASFSYAVLEVKKNVIFVHDR